MDKGYNEIKSRLKGKDSTFNKEKSLADICIPVEAISFLLKETSFRNPARFSKLEAFYDIVNRHLKAHGKAKVDEGVNVTRLVKSWCWTRTTVIKFIHVLQNLGLVKVETLNVENRITLNPDVIHWNMSLPKGQEKPGEDFIQSQTSLQHIPSGEIKEMDS